MPIYTLKPGHARTFLTGVARRPGEAVEIASPGTLGPSDLETLKTHFDRVGGDAEGKPAGPALLRNGLTEEQARAKLSKAGVTFADGVRGDGLADLFDKVFDPHTGADAASGRNAQQPGGKTPEGEAAPVPGGEPPVQEAAPAAAERKRAK